MEAVGISYLHPNIHEIILWFDRRADLVIVMIDCHNYCGLRVEVIREVDNLEGIKLKAQYRKVTKGDYKHIHTTIGLSLFDCSGHYIWWPNWRMRLACNHDDDSFFVEMCIW